MIEHGGIVSFAPDQDGLYRHQRRWKVTKDQTRPFDLFQGGGRRRDSKPSRDQPHLGLDIMGILGGTWFGARFGASRHEGIIVAMLAVRMDHHELLLMKIFP